MRLTNTDLAARARRIALVLTDCDGVLTDTGVYYSELGEQMKRFSIRDGMGAERLRNAGIASAIITGERSGSVARRAEKLQMDVHLGIEDKVGEIRGLANRRGIELGDIAYIGDDVNDLPAIELVSDHGGLSATPRDGMTMVAERVHYVARAPGGHGAFRDFAEWLLRLRGSG